MDFERLTVGRLAKRAGVNVETIRYYQRRGLFPIPSSSPSSVRRYSKADLQRLRFIKRAQQLGFTLDEISELMNLSEGHGCSIACSVGERRLADLERKIVDLIAMREALRGLVGKCQRNAPRAPCPLIEAIAQ